MKELNKIIKEKNNKIGNLKEENNKMMKELKNVM